MATQKTKTLTLPAPPEWLDQDARFEWDRALSSIATRDAAALDFTLFEVYCQSFSRWLRAERDIAENGSEIILRNDKGEFKAAIPSPQVTVSAKAYDVMVKARRSCGLERAREIVAAAA